MEIIMQVNDFINGIVWGVPLLVLILATGLFYTIRLGFFQFARPGFLFRETIVKAFSKKDEGKPAAGELTSFQAAMTSVAAIVGSGNIAGVATAIVMGGPGAVLWLRRECEEEEKVEKESGERSVANISITKAALGLLICILAFFAVVNNFVKDGLTTWTPDILNALYGTQDWLSILLTLLLPLLAIPGTVFAVKVYNVVKRCLYRNVHYVGSAYGSRYRLHLRLVGLGSLPHYYGRCFLDDLGADVGYRQYYSKYGAASAQE